MSKDGFSPFRQRNFSLRSLFAFVNWIIFFSVLPSRVSIVGVSESAPVAAVLFELSGFAGSISTSHDSVGRKPKTDFGLDSPLLEHQLNMPRMHPPFLPADPESDGCQTVDLRQQAA